MNITIERIEALQFITAIVTMGDLLLSSIFILIFSIQQRQFACAETELILSLKLHGKK